MITPLVSIILPVFNAEDFIEETLMSLINQTYKNIEIIVLDDGSTDGSLSIIKSFSDKHENFKVVSRCNKGLIITLNELLSLSSGCFIARADADDIYSKERIEKQVYYLLENIDVAVVGSSYNIIDEHGTIIGHRRQFTRPEMLHVGIVFGSPLAHPSVMINKDICGGHLFYDENYPHAEDYELWVRLVYECNLKVANIAEKLFSYRVHKNSVSSKYADEQQLSMLNALLNNNKASSMRNRLPRIMNKTSLLSLFDMYLILKYASLSGVRGNVFSLYRIIIAQITKARFKFKYIKSLR